MSLFKLDSFRVLRPGWDTYDGKPISERAIAAAESMQAVPVPNGGVQLEWHVNGQDIEIEFEADGSVSVCVASASSRKERRDA